MPRFRRVFSSLLLIFLVSAVTADAGPILYTDRDAFNQAVGASTVVTFDQPQPCTYDFVSRTCTVTYDNLVTFTFDAVGGVGVMPDYITMGRSGLAASARVLAPVTAFGFDVIGAGQGLVPFAGQWFQLNGPQFFGIVSDAPFVPEFSYANLGFTAPYSIDNLVVKTVPEPATLLLAALGYGAVALQRKRRKAPRPPLPSA